MASKMKGNGHFLKGQLGEGETEGGRLAPYRGLTKPFEAENKVCSTKFKVIPGLAHG